VHGNLIAAVSFQVLKASMRTSAVLIRGVCYHRVLLRQISTEVILASSEINKGHEKPLTIIDNCIWS